MSRFDNSKIEQEDTREIRGKTKLRKITLRGSIGPEDAHSRQLKETRRLLLATFLYSAPKETLIFRVNA